MNLIDDKILLKQACLVQRLIAELDILECSKDKKFDILKSETSHLLVYLNCHVMDIDITTSPSLTKIKA